MSLRAAFFGLNRIPPPPPSTLLDDLVAAWSMNAASGDESDLVGANDATAYNTPGSAAGKLGNARTTGGTAHFGVADSADVSMGAGARFTLAVWFNPSALGSDQNLFGKRGDGSNIEYWLRASGTTLNFAVSSDGTIGGITSLDHGTSLSNDNWYLAVAAYDGSNLKLSLNGGAWATTAFSADVFDGPQMLGIGAYKNSAGEQNNAFSGSIDDCFLWKRALSDAEVAELYNAGAGLAYPFS